MFNLKKRSSAPVIGVSLVDGDSTVRHARQLMLLSEGYDVRSYAACAALLADPQARDYPCIILNFEMGNIGGLELLRQMRANGWRGKALLLDGPPSANPMLQKAERYGDTVLPHDVGNLALLTAIASLVG